MMANWLGNPEKVYSDRDVSLSAAPIGTVLAAILHDKLQRQKMTQESIADTIKNVQAYRQRDAYTEALRNAGLTQGQDISGLSDPDATRLAQLIQQQTPDTQRDALLEAQTKEANARAGLYEKYGENQGGGDGGDGGANIVWKDGMAFVERYDKYGNVHLVQVRTPAGPKPQTQGDLKSELANVGVTGEGMSKSEEQYGVLPSGERVPKDRPWTDAGTIYVPGAEGGKIPMTIEKFRHLKKALGMPDPNPTPAPSPTPGATPGVTPSGTPQPAPAQTGTPIPTSRVTPIPSDQAGGHAGNYGVVMTSLDKDALAWARTHSGDPRAAEILKRLGVQ